MGDWMTWKEFNDAVLALLPIERTRLIQGDENGTLLSSYIRLGVIDIQQFIPLYRMGHECIYHPADFAVEGCASKGVMPPEAAVRDAWQLNTATGVRYPLRDFPWEDRYELTSGEAAPIDNNGLICIDPQGYQFYTWPAVTDPKIFAVTWDGIRLDFSDEDHTPFDEGVVQAVAEYVEGRMARKIDNDLNKYMSYFHKTDGSYHVKRRDLWLLAKEKTRIKR